jgi:hypothetical protein
MTSTSGSLPVSSSSCKSGTLLSHYTMLLSLARYSWVAETGVFSLALVTCEQPAQYRAGAAP